MNKNYLIHLSGQGDDIYIPVSKATFDWINSPRPTFSFNEYSVEETVPQFVLDDFPNCVPGQENEHGFRPDIVTVSTGSCENDRALHLSCMEGYSHEYITGNWKDVWEGWIY